MVIMTWMKFASTLVPHVQRGSPFFQFSRHIMCACVTQSMRSFGTFGNKRSWITVYNKNVDSNISAVVYPLTSQMSLRCYAKGKDKKKEKGKKKVSLDERILGEVLPVEDIKDEMQKEVDHLKEEYVQALSLRSTSGAIENLRVSFEGKEYAIQELAQVARKDTKTVIVNMTAFPQAIQAVLKSIQKSGMNLNPQQDGTTLYIPIPRVTTEHREQLAKNAKVLFLQCRDKLKHLQIKYEKQLKSDTSLSQDSVFNAQQQLTALVDNFVNTANSMFEIKHKELTGK